MLNARYNPAAGAAISAALERLRDAGWRPVEFITNACSEHVTVNRFMPVSNIAATYQTRLTLRRHGELAWLDTVPEFGADCILDTSKSIADAVFGRDPIAPYEAVELLRPNCKVVNS